MPSLFPGMPPSLVLQGPWDPDGRHRESTEPSLQPAESFLLTWLHPTHPSGLSQASPFQKPHSLGLPLQDSPPGRVDEPSTQLDLDPRVQHPALGELLAEADSRACTGQVSLRLFAFPSSFRNHSLIYPRSID